MIIDKIFFKAKAYLHIWMLRELKIVFFHYSVVKFKKSKSIIRGNMNAF